MIFPQKQFPLATCQQVQPVCMKLKTHASSETP